jgi:hypothetical protein
LLFCWPSGCIEEKIVGAVLDVQLENLIIDQAGVKTGMRLRSLADLLGISDKDLLPSKKMLATTSEHLSLLRHSVLYLRVRRARRTNTRRMPGRWSNDRHLICPLLKVHSIGESAHDPKRTFIKFWDTMVIC